ANEWNSEANDYESKDLYSYKSDGYESVEDAYQEPK
ncbi:hypothetical protein PENNAL_c0320G05732, partial [Penicillium nalgiovense]